MDDQREEALRNEAINRRLAGERRCDICRALGRSTAWFDKWWARYRRYGRAGLKSRSRAPQHVHNKMAPEVEEAIVRIRKVLEEQTDPELKYAFIGAPTIRTELKRTPLRPVPSVRAIERALQRRELTRPRRKRKHPNEPTAYCPLPVVQGPNDVHAMDIITRHLLGGERICSFHLLDLASHYPVLRQYPDKSAVSAKAFLVTTWQTVGLPKLLQMDNEATFCGGYRGKRVFSQIVRLCLNVGVEVVFIPFYSPKKNADIESFHSDWAQAFWQRERFRDLAHVQEECPIFERWYRTRYEPPALKGLTPTEARADFVPRLLPADFNLHQAEERLPLTAGKVHFIRLVNSQGQVKILNERWTVGEELVGEYVWATISTAEQRLCIYHQAAVDAAQQLVAEYQYEITEEAQDLTLAYCTDGQAHASV
jgi:transposase InsO family protein